LIALCLTSCGYRFGRGEVCQRYSTVCVPYVEGDKDGLFTSALIKAFTTSGCLAYGGYGSDLALKVSLLPPEDINIGYEYAPADEATGFSSNVVVANEARLTLVASVLLIDRRTGMTVLGPLKIGRYLDYDFEPDLSTVNFHAFSLGQLEMHNLAEDAAFPALYKLLAEKIVDYVNHGW
jgi:hypothetical protein